MHRALLKVNPKLDSKVAWALAQNFEKHALEMEESLQEFSAKAHGRKIKTWDFSSKSNPSKTYETVKWEDGTYSCNCPGWTRRVKNGKRFCTHVDQVGGSPAKA